MFNKISIRKNFLLAVFLFFLSVIFELFPSLGYEKIYLVHEKIPDGVLYEVKNRGARGSISFNYNGVKYLSSCTYFLDSLCLNSKHGQEFKGKSVYVLKIVGTDMIAHSMVTEGEFLSGGQTLKVFPVPREYIEKYANTTIYGFKIKRAFSIIVFSYLMVMSFIYFIFYKKQTIN
ncbi:hypothetical protein ACFPVS_09920 [Neisseria weixii]|uniref:Uncharacterized protein n=1 Tax=Neisseria weixii TaxID=1853276 RepID=A0A3N4N7S8_9NEIS|nr:hypothetical protein [Neisseria weixii]ATD65498.1 hypothetical protein CGZ65_09870 [Neisseria weixii]RPD83303.1 hypothetical protein EGK74_12845 [Neisseria weixii]RPD83706.1 hypothetical protein EGK75_12905 [Neisseria weixii]